ncbi:MAG: inorganic phosphate transporter, partial [Chlamydiia bacterium]|nr:inorganic phosphate transporter [Chlamydiia bacterium]
EWTIVAIVVLGLLFDYTNGFHDAANVVATVIATRALAPLSAIVMAGVLNFIGATQISGVAQTIASGLARSEEISQIVVLSTVLGAILWNLVTWYYGMPSSSSYALIGGLLGSAWAHEGMDAIFWDQVGRMVLVPMALSPCIGFFFSFVFMKVLFYYLTKRPSVENKKIFKHLQIGSACFVALSHGLNDAQKSMGIITLGLFSAGHLVSPIIPFWVIIACAVVMGLGTGSGGFRIIRTMGFSITELNSVQGFAAELSASTVILTASFLGMPVSSTHVIAGGITGVGIAKSKSAVDWSVPRKILLAMCFTLPGCSILGAGLYFFLRMVT